MTVEKDILTYLLSELNDQVVSDDTSAPALTKGKALVKSMVDAALGGDQRMMANVLRLMEKLENVELGATEQERSPTQDWLEVFAFYAKYKKLIEAEIRKLKKENPHYWSFEWFKPTLTSAPWYKDLYIKKQPVS